MLIQMEDNQDHAIYSAFNRLVEAYGLHPCDVRVRLINDLEVKLEFVDGPLYGNDLTDKKFDRLYKDLEVDPATDEVCVDSARDLYDRMKRLLDRSLASRRSR